MMKQLRLFPETRPEAREAVVRLVDLPSDEDLLGPDPTPAFVRSVGRFGVIQSLVLLERRDG
jgi:hypothetical protein